MRIGIAAWWDRVESAPTAALKAAGYDVADFGAHELANPSDFSDSYCRDPNHAQ